VQTLETGDECDVDDAGNAVVEQLLGQTMPAGSQGTGIAKQICLNKRWRDAHSAIHPDMCGEGKQYPLQFSGPKGTGANDYCKQCDCNGADLKCEGDDRTCFMPFTGLTDAMPAGTHVCEFTSCTMKKGALTQLLPGVDYSQSLGDISATLRVKHTRAIAGLDFKCAHNVVTGVCTCMCHGTRGSSIVGPMLAGEHKLSIFEGEQCQKVPFRFPDYTDAQFDLSKGQVHVVTSLQDHDNLGRGEMDHVPSVSWVESVRDTYFILCMKQDGQFESLLPFSLRSLPKVNYIAWQGENDRHVDYSPFPHATSGSTTIALDLTSPLGEECQTIEYSTFGKEMFQAAQLLSSNDLPTPAILGSLQYSRRYSNNPTDEQYLAPLSSYIADVTNDGFKVCISPIAGEGTLSAAESTSPDFGDEATAPEQPDAAVTFTWTAFAPQSKSHGSLVRLYATAGRATADAAEWKTTRLVEGGHEYMHMQCQTVPIDDKDEDNRNFVHPIVIITPVEDPVNNLRKHNMTDVWVEAVSSKSFDICAAEISLNVSPPSEQQWNYAVFNSNGRWKDIEGPWSSNDEAVSMP